MDDASIYPEEVVISIHAPREGGDDPTAEVLLSS